MTENMQELVDRFLSGEMEEEERKKFEQRIDEDEELKAQVDNYQVITGVLENEVEENLRDRFKEIDRQENSWDQKESSFNRYWRLAAGIAAGLIIILAIWKQTADINPQQIVDRYGVVDNIDKYRSISTEETFSEDEKRYLDQMKQASSFLRNEDFDAARSIYESLDDSIPIIRDNKEWAIAMSHYLENGRKNKKFQEILDKILRMPEHNCYEQAVQVENEVNSFWGRLKK